MRESDLLPILNRIIAKFAESQKLHEEAELELRNLRALVYNVAEIETSRRLKTNSYAAEKK